MLLFVALAIRFEVCDVTGGSTFEHYAQVLSNRSDMSVVCSYLGIGKPSAQAQASIKPGLTHQVFEFA
jgi:hypothetical protein